MSQQRLLNFLNELDKELQRSSDVYRNETANKKYTIFTYRSSTIVKTLDRLLQAASSLSDKEEGKRIKEILKNIEKPLNVLTESLKTDFKDLANKSKGTIVYRQVKDGLRIRADETGKRDNFKLCQRTYKEHLDTFYEAFLAEVGKPIVRPSKTAEGGTVNVQTAGQAFNLEHLKGGSNIQDFINDSIFKALEEVYNSDGEALKDDLEAEGFKELLRVVKNAKDGKINIFIGSQIANALESKKERQLKADLEKALKKAVEKLGTIEQLSGSDSLSEGARKKHVDLLLDPFKKIKGVKVTKETTKVKEGQPASLSKKVTSKKVSKPRLNMKKGSIRTSKPKRGFNQLQLIGVLNSKIQKTVQQNMGSPALNYQSGRFASSVRVLDVNETRQGYFSFGYTYQKSPYQTFELGYAQGSSDRDPRKLIDKSIREIAAEYAVGRFYTRRL